MIVKQRWKEPLYTKKEINNAGNILREKFIAEEEKKEALEIVDNWRSAHAYPLHVFYMNLRRHSNSRSNIIVAERLKRLGSIVSKLQREHGMQLYRMQDLGGCRMVLPTIEDVYGYSQKIMNSRIRHELKKINDYIAKPKKSGYRSLHYIYRFNSDEPSKSIYNRYPMLIELQFRTHLEHIWATAVETIGLFTNQALKAGFGDESIKRFFILVSSLFAIQENEPIVPGTSNNTADLVNELKELDSQFHIIEMLRAIRIAIHHEIIPDKRGYYILQLDYRNHIIKTRFFMPSENEVANDYYDKLEQQYSGNALDVVMVRASSFSMVKQAYPNYFLDIGEFVNIIENYIV